MIINTVLPTQHEWKDKTALPACRFRVVRFDSKKSKYILEPVIQDNKGE